MKKIRLSFPGFLLAGLLFSCAPHESVLHVSPGGSDDNDGTASRPLKSITAAVRHAVPGQTLYIHEGIYREAVLIPPEKKRIRLVAWQKGKPVLKGSDIMKGWERKGRYWYRIVKIKPQQVMVDGDHPLQQIGYPNDDFRAVHNYPRYEYPVGKNLADMAPGRFFWSGDTLYLWLKHSDDPNIHQIEVSRREYVIRVEADSVYLKGLTIRHSNVNTFSEQGAAVSLGNYSVIEDCDVQWCDFGGISMGYRRKGSRAIRCNASHNGATGFNASATEGFLIKECTANFNNYRNFYAQWHAGGFKGASSAYGTIKNSEFAYNKGGGIWFDYCFAMTKYRNNGVQPIVIINNFIHDNSPGADPNKNAALMLEVSERILVANNLIVHNGLRGLYVSASWDVNVVNNTIAKNFGYCTVDIAGMPRGKVGKLINIVFENNILYDNHTRYDLHLLMENGRDIRDVVSDHNLYYRKSDSLFLWYSSDARGNWQGPVYHSLIQWQEKTPFDRHSLRDDPAFADEKYHLSSTSPCIDAGDCKAAAGITEDHDGRPRVSGKSIDLGAYEIQ